MKKNKLNMNLSMFGNADNVIEYLPIVQEGLDQKMQQGLTSIWMEPNASQVKYEGGNKVKIATIATDGLGDYGRDGDGYPLGAFTLEFKEYPMTQDRGQTFLFDRHDVDETNFIVTSSSVIGVFQDEHVIPEIDSYRYSSLAQKAIEAGHSNEIELTEEIILQKFMKDVREIQDRTGVDLNQLIATIPYNIYYLLDKVAINKGTITLENFDGSVKTEVRTINEVPVIPVQSSRMKTKYVFHDGKAKAGFEAASDAQDINWIICPITAPVAVNKTDRLKVFTPDENQDADDWKTQYRNYHEVWVFENRLDRFQASLAPKSSGE